LLYKLIKAREEGDQVRFGLAVLVYIQHMDRTVYDSVNFDDPISTLSYFKKIYQIFTRKSDEEVDDDIETMMYFFKLRTAERGSKLYAEAQAHQIMRSVAERIHVTFRELEWEEEGTRAVYVTEMMVETVISLLKLMRDCIVEECNHLETLSRIQLIRDRDKKDSDD